MEFHYHPIIEELRVNEDGSEIIFKGQKLELHFLEKRPTPRVHFNRKSHSVLKLVCETWNGIRPNRDMRVSRIDPKGNNYHYTNLEWKISANNGVEMFSQKLSENDIENIIRMSQAGYKNVEIAKEFNVSSTHIARIKKKHGKKD